MKLKDERIEHVCHKKRQLSDPGPGQISREKPNRKVVKESSLVPSRKQFIKRILENVGATSYSEMNRMAFKGG